MSRSKKKALNLLFHPEIYPGMAKKEVTEVKLVFWRNDTLGEYSTWTFFNTGKSCIVRRVIWNQRTTYNLEDPETYCMDCIIPEDLYTRICDSFPKISFYYMKKIEKAMPLDGIEYGIIFQGHEINWWNTSSKEVLELNKWYENIIIKLESLFF